MDIVILAFAVSAISFTISTTSIFEWLRELVSKIHPKLEELIHCPFCLSFYVSLVAVITWESPVWAYPIFTTITYIFGVMGMSGVIHYVLLRAYEPVMKNMMMRQREKNQKTN